MNSVRTIKIEESSQALFSELTALLKEHREFLREIETLLADFRRLCVFEISDELLDDEGVVSFTFSDLE